MTVIYIFKKYISQVNHFSNHKHHITRTVFYVIVTNNKLQYGLQKKNINKKTTLTPLRDNCFILYNADLTKVQSAQEDSWKYC